MSINIIVVILLNFIISLIGTLAYAVRIVGVRTGKIAISLALFNALALISRTAGSLQLPLLTNFVEKSKDANSVLFVFNIILLVVFIATIVGAFMIPTFQRMLSRGVEAFSMDKSFYKLAMHSFSRSGVKFIRNCVSVPAKGNLTLRNFKKLPVKVLVYNVLAVALFTAGGFAPVYACILAPDLRATCITLSAVVNGLATILLALFIDPYLSALTDEVVENKYSEADFRGCVIGMVGSKILGSILALVILIPSAYAITFVARFI